MKLSQYAKAQSIGYKAAWNRFKAGKIKGAYISDTGAIIVPEPEDLRPERTAVYARVSSSENRSNLKTQSKRLQDFCAAKGWVVSDVVEECGSGLNDERPKLTKLLLNPDITRIVVEHKDRLTRFGYNYIKSLWKGELVVINEAADDEHDLMQDFVSLVTSFTARLYGRRLSRRATEKLIEELNKDNGSN